MKVAEIQMDIVPNDIAANCATAARLIDEAMERDRDISLIVLPEMFSTGFTMQPREYADKAGATLRWMQAVSDSRGVAVTGSVAVEDDGKYYNRMYFVRPHVDVVHYDKRHLFTYSGEDQHYEAGTQRVVVEWQGVRFLLMVCYDLRFPVWSRSRKDYDAIIYVASWPESRRLAWDILLRGRAIENQCYVYGVNRVGHDGLCPYNGGTIAVHPYGTTLAAAANSEECCITSELDVTWLEGFRLKFPVLDDRD